MKHQELIFIVEDDVSIAKVLELALVQNGYKTQKYDKKSTALRDIKVYNPSLILLDLGLVDGDGKELIQSLRQISSIPIIVISARTDEKEIINALDIGADDYITKPFSVDQLLARIRGVLRRFSNTITNTQILSCDEIVLSLDSKEIKKNGEFIKLTPTEYNLLKYFMLNKNKTLTHRQILNDVWGVGYQQEMQYLRTYINSLRKKIETNSTLPKYIKTESSFGYRFSCDTKETNE